MFASSSDFLTNYYDILGIGTGATMAEIKAAFRALAKLYHPDKNPEGQEHFKKILRAYETLSNPARKSSYDLRLKYHKESATTHQSSKTKNWSFEEKELKRRQYYNDHIKKYEKVKKAKAEHDQLKTNYNEYKYILYATPVAVALFLLVIHFATPSHRTTANAPGASAPISRTELQNGEEIYADYFGPGIFVSSSPVKLNIKNSSGEDMIVCLFTENGFVRSCVVKDGFQAEIPQLPEKPLQIRYESGSQWNALQPIKEANTKGAFTRNLNFYKSNGFVEPGAINELTIVPRLNEGFVSTSAREFFKKENI